MSGIQFNNFGEYYTVFTGDWRWSSIPLLVGMGGVATRRQWLLSAWAGEDILCCFANIRISLTNTINTRSHSTDAFKDAADEPGASQGDKVHVRVQQRNGRKCITTVAGLADDLDVKRICKAFKKNFSCNGALQKDEEDKEVIQLSGDQRTNVKEFLVDQEICHSDAIVLHGF
eukprot:scaffold2931_cov204-Alexandrium_tamarense.AAC.20